MYWIMTFKNNKTIYATMLSAMIAAVLVLSTTGTHNAFADTPIDTTDYFGQALKVFNERQKISLEAAGLQQQIDDLKASSTTDTSTINTRIASLQQQLDADNAQMDSDTKEIKRLETLNIKSYQVDQQTAKKLLDAQNAIREKYNVRSDNLYSDKPVQLVYANFKYRTIVVMLDPSKVTGNPESLVAKTVGANGESISESIDAKTLQSIEPTKDIAVDIQYGKVTPTSCPSRTQVCTPLVGGVSISNIAVHTLNTIGYRAFSGQTAGFVIAGHTATESNTIVQPYQSNNVIGTVSLKCPNYDCAFVPVSQQTLNSIYINGVTQWAITANIPASQQVAGTYVYKTGAGSGVTMGQIINPPNPAGGVGQAQMTVSGGDSGAPVVQDSTGTTSHLDGQLFAQAGNTGLYNTWDIVKSQIGVTPS
jgi:hypothetical protein